MALTSREKFSLLLPREFLTRGKFRLLFLLSSSFLKKKEIDRNSAFNVSSNVFFPFRFVSTTSEPVCSLCSSSSAPSVRRWVSCSSFPPPPFPLSPHARTFTHRGKKSRSLRIQPEFTHHPRSSNSAPCDEASCTQLGEIHAERDRRKMRGHAVAIVGILTIVPILPVLFARSLIGHIGVGFKRKGGPKRRWKLKEESWKERRPV